MSTHGLLLTLFFLVFISAFFSASETSMMAVNRYRVRHLARQKHRAAMRTQKLLEHPDRLLGIVLIGNTIANISASAVATLLAVEYFGNVGVAIVTGLLTFILLVFSELAPKTLAAVYPQRLAFLTSFPLLILLKIFYPLIWIINAITNGFLKLFGIKVPGHVLEHISLEELRTLLHESKGRIPPSHQEMLLRLVDLGEMRVEDAMIPRNDIEAINLDAPWPEIVTQLERSTYTRLPVYADDWSQVKGMLNLRKIQILIAQRQLTKDHMIATLMEAYFIPEGTSLNAQLLHFRRQNLRMGLVVDEYGDVIGLITLEDIIEEIVGDLEGDHGPAHQAIQPQSDGSYLIRGNISVRELNRLMGWELAVHGPKTLSGLITEYLEMIPQAGIALRLGRVPMEIVEVRGKTVKLVRVFPTRKK